MKTALGRNEVAALNLKQQQRGRRAVVKAFRRLLNDQVKSIVAELRATKTPVALVLFNAVAWNDQVEETGRDVLGRIYVENALAELKIHKQSPAKAVGEDAIVPFEIPPWMLNAVRSELDETFEQSYWADISKTTGDDLNRLLLAGVEDGLTIRQIADSIIRDMGASYSRFRSTNIART